MNRVSQGERCPLLAGKVRVGHASHSFQIPGLGMVQMIFPHPDAGSEVDSLMGVKLDRNRMESRAEIFVRTIDD